MTLSIKNFEKLLQSGRALSSSLQVDQVLTTVMELARQVVEAEASSLLLLDDHTQELVFHVALGDVGDQIKQKRLPLGQGIAGWVAKEKTGLIVNDVQSDARFSEITDQTTKFVTRSVLAVPLLVKGRLVGVIEAINKEANGAFTDGDKEALDNFAAQAAVAIENAHLFTAVQKSKEKLQTVFDHMSEGVFYLDQQGSIDIVNAEAGRFLGVEKAFLQGQSFSVDLFPGFTFDPPFESVVKKADKNGVLLAKRKTGKDFFLELRVIPMNALPKTGQDGWLVVATDVTETLREEKIKRSFLSLISHKLKTPLTVIMGYVPILKSTLESPLPIQDKALVALADQTAHLNGLVEKLLRFSMLEADSFEEVREVLPVTRCIKDALQSLSHVIKARHVAVAFEENSVPWSVKADHNLLTDVFRNIVENAIKFNNGAQPRVGIRVSSSGSHLKMVVEDNGPGIPPEDTLKVFQKFYQVDNNFTGQVPGAGLGLSFSRKIVESLGGEISISSRLGAGTAVTITLPVA